MASDRGYLDYVLDLLSETEGITHRAMMGETMLYCRGKLFGGVYDDRFLVKITPSSRALLEDAEEEIPYEGAKPMLPVTSEDRAFLRALAEAMWPELPQPKPRKTGKR